VEIRVTCTERSRSIRGKKILSICSLSFGEGGGVRFKIVVQTREKTKNIPLKINISPFMVRVKNIDFQLIGVPFYIKMRNGFKKMTFLSSHHRKLAD